jgi:hypothetical protein
VPAEQDPERAGRVPPPGDERDPWVDEVEFEDEEPGALLREVRVDTGVLVWGYVLVVAVTAFGGYGSALRAAAVELPDASLGFPLEVAWSLLGVAATFGLLATIFVWLSLRSAEPHRARRAVHALRLQGLALLLWLAARFLAGARFI